MNIVKPYARIVRFAEFDSGLDVLPIAAFSLAHGIALLRKIEWFGRISHRSEDKQTANSWERFIRAVVLDHGDWSIAEHATVSVDMVVDRGITHELVRHRLFSFTQESTRFVNYEKKMPPSFIKPEGVNGTGLGWEQEFCWNSAIQECEDMYQQMIRLGVPPQIARSVLPNTLASRIGMTGNLRSWRHFLLMRTTRESHPQMKQVTIPLLAEFKETIPILFEDIEPEAKQSVNLKKGK